MLEKIEAKFWALALLAPWIFLGALGLWELMPLFMMLIPVALLAGLIFYTYDSVIWLLKKLN